MFDLDLTRQSLHASHVGDASCRYQFYSNLLVLLTPLTAAAAGAAFVHNRSLLSAASRLNPRSTTANALCKIIHHFTQDFLSLYEYTRNFLIMFIFENILKLRGWE